ncbi:DUF2254 domain-containing protein [Methylobacterium sp. J-026]|uniref:type VI secretion system baseplate subunit TssK n=1 Tax=Methylobacterium sp. J-026 TaxID=2836624 RepID=UPI001FBA06B1|nr:type VI secretion system baseplate subunit TssK [Methylobacterium sp. J-026]MCJ2135310.1 DUF2254 domain-containing protein [Methylobacterium sp. J-026]
MVDRLLALARRSLREFIGLPLIVIAGFFGLFALTYVLDDILWGGPGPAPLPWLAHLLGDTAAIASLLGTVASGMITVTSITFSLLLIAVQQTAATLSTDVYDQFIQRRSNKVSFGFFVGLSVFVLLTLGSASPEHKPILGALLSLLMTGAALCLVVILIYSTIDQMRPHSVVTAIHGHTLKARAAEQPLIEATRRTPREGLPWSQIVRTDAYGVVCDLDVPAIERSAARHDTDIEIIARIGTHVAFRDPLYRLHAPRPLTADARAALEKAVGAAIRIEPRRTIDRDAGFGLEQLSSIAWTTASTSKQNPQPAILVCHGLRDIIARWSCAGPIPERAASRVIYRDKAVDDAILAIAAIGVVASESMQNTLAAEVWRTLATLIADVMLALRRSLSAVIEQSAIQIPLQDRKYGIRVGLIPDKTLLTTAGFVLVVKAALPEDTIRRALPALIKIGPVEQIRELVNVQLPGIPVQPLAVAPRQLPYHSGAVYFELKPDSPLWASLATSGGVAVHLSGDFPDAHMELWAIRR